MKLKSKSNFSDLLKSLSMALSKYGLFFGSMRDRKLCAQVSKSNYELLKLKKIVQRLDSNTKSTAGSK